MGVRDNQITGNIGLYYCCHQLSRMGWNVMPTSRNAKGVDIIAYKDDARRLLSIQVKTLSKRNPVPLGNSKEKILGHYWIIINKAASDNPEVFVLTPEEVTMLAKKGEKDGKVSYWLQPPDYDRNEFKGRWDRIENTTI